MFGRTVTLLVLVAGASAVAIVSTAAGGAAQTAGFTRVAGSTRTTSSRIKRPLRTSVAPGIGSTALGQIVRAQQTDGTPAAVAVARAEGIKVTPQGARLIVVARPGAAAAAKEAVVVRGGTVEAVAGDLVQALLPLASISAVAADSAVTLVRQPARAVPQAVTVGEEVAALNAAGYTASGFDGTGTKVAIIDLGFTGYAALLGNELPASVTTQDSCGGALTTASEHGTAVAEIVHEVAPGAQLFLICIDSEVTLASAEAYAKAQGIKIVSHSLGWFNTAKGDGTGALGSPDATVADARANGILWVNSAGNSAQIHWSGTYVDDGSGLNLFSVGTNVNQFTLTGGATACIELKWNAWPTTHLDYDLGLYRMSDSTNVASSVIDQFGGTNIPPTEEICYTNPGATANFGVAIGRFDAPSSPRLDLFVLGAGGIQFQTAAGSISEPASSPNALAVGAVCFSGFGLEPYSSQGPNIAGVIKPDISGYDSVSSLTYGAFSGCGVSGFSGTSAAAPGIAGAAALLLQQTPGLTPALLQSKLESFAVDLGAAGKDNLFGSGREALPTLPLKSAVAPTS